MKIKNRLFKSKEFKRAKTILFYVSTKNEVRTEKMIKQALKIGKKVIVPITEKHKKLTLSELHDYNELTKGKFNILEPKIVRKVKLNDINLIIVPGIAFDASGNRIGYGHGYYDRLLKKTTRIPFIGLAYESQVVNKIPSECHDVPVHKIITNRRVINCANL